MLPTFLGMKLIIETRTSGFFKREQLEDSLKSVIKKKKKPVTAPLNRPAHRELGRRQAVRIINFLGGPETASFSYLPSQSQLNTIGYFKGKTFSSSGIRISV